MQIDPPVTPGPEPGRLAMEALPTAPAELVYIPNEYRLIAGLRGRAAARDRNTGLPDPTVWLAHAAVEYVKATRMVGAPRDMGTRFGTAIADLTVTGRQTYDQFRKGINPLQLE